VTNRQPRDIAASVRNRLLNLSRDRGEEYQFMLTRYGLERVLYRLTQSPHADQFVLKGAALFQLWTGQPHRSTRDLDLLGKGVPSTERLQKMFQEICSVAVEDDGLTFLPDRIQAAQIKENDDYQGIRLRIDALLGNARINLQIDIGFGDAVTPAPQMATFPTLLDFPAPQLQAYPRETVVAEKFQAMVALGMSNSRMKDFYDIWMLARQFEFDGPTLCAALHATFDRRRTRLPASTPLALTSEFSGDRIKAIQWTAFLKKGKLVDHPTEFSEVIEFLSTFLMPPTLALVSQSRWDHPWSQGKWI
jgi:predicted nucleotidyltransferase component of viral defense system